MTTLMLFYSCVVSAKQNTGLGVGGQFEYFAHKVIKK